MRLGKHLLDKVRSSFQMIRLARVVSGKPVKYQQALFSDNYHEEYCRYEQQSDGSYVVESKDKGLFGVRGGLPNFILDWLKISYHRGNEAYLTFLSYFEQRLVELRHEKAKMRSVVYRAETASNEKSREQLANQYFSSLNFDHDEYNIIPSTLLNRHAGRSMTSIHRMLGFYFPYQFEIETDDIEWKVIAPESRSRLGHTQLGRGVVLGHKYPQLSQHVTVKIIISDAEQFELFANETTEAAKQLTQIKELCQQCFSEHASIDVVAQFTGIRTTPKALTKRKGQAITLGCNAQLLTKENSQLQQIRKH